MWLIILLFQCLFCPVLESLAFDWYPPVNNVFLFTGYFQRVLFCFVSSFQKLNYVVFWLGVSRIIFSGTPLDSVGLPFFQNIWEGFSHYFFTYFLAPLSPVLGNPDVSSFITVSQDNFFSLFSFFDFR